MIHFFHLDCLFYNRWSKLKGKKKSNETPQIWSVCYETDNINEGNGLSNSYQKLKESILHKNL